MNKTALPLDLPLEDGPLYAAQKKVYPQSVSGTFRRTKWGLMAFCLGVYYLLPFVRWNRGLGAPDQAVLVDLPNRRFYFFFIELWPQEVYYFTGLLIIAAVALFLMNAIGGRIWCGYLCPQTVWTDLFYAVERLIEGDRRVRMKKDASADPMKLERIADCVDCYQCVAVCPTGIDIRNGSQLECIQCGLCIDACDSVMTKIGRPTRLIGYDNDINIQRREAGKPPIYRTVRPRTIVYSSVIALVGAI